MKVQRLFLVGLLFLTFLAALFLAGHSRAARATASGDLDTAFGTGGAVLTAFRPETSETARGVAVQTDGKIVVVGTTFVPAGEVAYPAFALARYHADGTPDTDFDTDGQVVTDSIGATGAEARAVKLQSDGKILVAGATGDGDFVLARYHTNGSPDTGFGTSGIVITDFSGFVDEASALALDTNGKIVVAGQSDPNGDFVWAFALARYNANGTPDTDFDTDGKATVQIETGASSRAFAVAIQTDGKIVAAGDVLDMSGYGNFALARFTAAGAPDTNFAGDGTLSTDFDLDNDPETSFSETVYSLALTSGGNIVAVGSEDSVRYFLLARYTAAGVLDNTFGNNGLVATTTADDARAAVLQTDGKIVVAGRVGSAPGFNAPTSDASFAIARYQANGALDTDFGANGIASPAFGPPDGRFLQAAYAVTLQADGKIVAAGTAGDGNGYRSFATARYLNAAGPSLSAQNVTRNQGAATANSTIASVSDPNQAANTLTVTINNGASATVNNVTVSNLSIANDGTVTADIATPNNAATANFTLTATNSANLSTQATLAVTVRTPPTINAQNVTRNQGAATANSIIATVSDADQAANTLTVTVNSGASATVNNVTVSNLNIANDGTVTADIATPNNATTANFTLTATNSANLFAQATLAVTVRTPPAISAQNVTRNQGAATANATIATVSDADQAANTLNFRVNGSTSSATVNNVTVNNLSFANDGTVMADIATPNNVTTAAFTLAVTNNAGLSAQATLTVTVRTPPTTSAQNVTRNQGAATANATIATVSDANQAANTLTVTVNNDTTATVNNVTVSNLSIANDGTVTADIATPCGAATANFTLRFTNNSNATASVTLTVTVNDGAPTIAAGNALTRQRGAPAGAAVTLATVNDGETPAGNLTVTASGNGLSITNLTNTNGTITAQVAASCSAPLANSITVTVTDGCNFTATTTLAVTVTSPAPNITPATVTRLQGAPAGAAVTLANVSNGDISAGSLTATISLPTGLSATNLTNTNGVITANVAASCAAAPGAYTLTLQVANSCGVTSASAVNVNVAASPPTINITLPVNTVSVENGAAPALVNLATVNDGETPPGQIAVTVSNLPNGVTLSNLTNTNGNITALIAANCEASGFSGNVTLHATDSCGTTSTATFTVIVLPDTTPTLGSYSNAGKPATGNLTVTPNAAPNNATRALTATVTPLNNTGPAFTGTATADPLTGNVRITNAGPAGNYTVTLLARNACATATRTFTLTVSNPTTCGVAPTLSPSGNSPFSVGNNPQDVAVGDFNQDGKQDLVVVSTGNPGPASYSILLGLGTGNFAYSAGSPVAAGDISPAAVSVADFNGDGKQDFVVAGSRVRIYLGNGGTTFSPQALATLSFSTLSAETLAVADFNRDGRPDVAIPNSLPNPHGTVTMLLGNGDGTLTQAGAPVTVGPSPRGIAAGDFNRDGKPDLAVANNAVAGNGDITANILLGDGAGGFSGNNSFAIPTAPGYYIAAGDFNEDNFQDLAISSAPSNPNVAIFSGNGNGGFTQASQSPYNLGQAGWGLAVSDFNGDGHQDIAAASPSGPVKFLYSRGNGTFALIRPLSINSTGARYRLATGDFNNDNAPDLVATDYDAVIGENYARVFRSDCISTTWVGPLLGPNGGWGNPSNWAGGSVPPSGASVVLPRIPNTLNSPASGEISITDADVLVEDLFLGANRLLTVGAGRTLTVNGTLTLEGKIDVPGTLRLGPDAVVNVQGGYVTGAINKTFGGGNNPVPDSFTYPTGTANGYTPVTLTAISGIGEFTARVDQTALPGYSANGLSRHWTLTNNGLTSVKLSFSYLDADVTGNETNYRIVKDTNGNGAPFTQPDGNADNVDEAANTATTINAVTTFSKWSVGEPNAPTLARVEKYEARRAPDGNLLQWQSSFEVNNLGFRVYRRDNSASQISDAKFQNGATPGTLITPNLIAGSALLAGPTALTAGQSYSWHDPDGTPASVYYIEDVDLDGTTTLHGPVTVRDEGWRMRDEIKSSPLLSELRPDTSTGIMETQVLPQELRPTKTLPSHPSSLIPHPSSLKLAVRRNGWYRVAGAQLFANGLDNNADARFLHLSRNGQQVPLAVRTESGREAAALGATGVIEFYGIAQDTRETDTAVYWLTVGDTPGLRIGPPVRVAPRGGDVEGGGSGSGISPLESGISIPGNTKVQISDSRSSFPYTVERKDRTLYFAALSNGDAENFFGAVINATPVSQTLDVHHLDAQATLPAALTVALQGATAGAHQVNVELNGSFIGIVQFADREHKVARLNVPSGVLAEGVNTVAMRALNSGDVSVTAYLQLTYAHRYEADDDQLLFSTGTRNNLAVTGFTVPEVRVFDLTQPGRYFEVATRITPAGGGYTVTVPSRLVNRQLLAVAGPRALSPAALVADEPSAWRAPGHAYDFVIVTPRALRNAAQPLAQLRQQQGLRTAVVTLEDIFDEWNFGHKDTAALRAFLRYAREKWNAGPAYVLLLGDASYDPRNYLGLGDSDLLPTAFAGTDYLETASDETLVDFDGDGVGEISVGRLPARNLLQAQALIARTVNYEPHPGGALLVSDRPDGYNFAAANQSLRQLLPADMPVTTLQRGAQPDAATRSQIVTALNAGPSLAVYAGHGSVQVWTGAPIFDINDALNAANGSRLPLVVTMTCLNGYFHDVHAESLAEALLRAPNGGGVAVWASSGLTEPIGQTQLAQAFVNAVYGSNRMRLGDAARLAKSQTNILAVRRTWLLFGDPTLAVSPLR